jgi:hypothetical protein
MTRTILTPVVDVDLSTVRSGKRSFWKRVLPVGVIDYEDGSGKKRKLEFSDSKPSGGNVINLVDVKTAFDSKVLDQLPFMLADKDNAHTMDPERYRADVTKVRLGGDDGPGLYAKVTFDNDQAAAAVLANRKLGVSMRLRETGDPKTPVVPIHVLGTLDPKITKLGEWHEAVELSSYAAGDEVVDLSTESYREPGMAKGKGKNKSTGEIDFATITAEDIDAGALEGVDLTELTDDELTKLVEAIGPDALAEAGDDEDLDGDDEDGADDEGETNLSAAAQHQIDLANARAEAAMQAAADAQKRVVDREWKIRRRQLLDMGIPADKVDLCEPYLKRPEGSGLVVDLSNTAGGGPKQAEVGKVIEELLLGYKGTIPVDLEFGHDGGSDADDAGSLDDELNKQFEASFPDMVPTPRRGATD